MTRVADIGIARSAFGITFINQYIYCCGGTSGWSQYLESCERYDMIQDKWKNYSQLPEQLIATTATKFEERYIYLIGGLNHPYDNALLHGHIINVLRIDTQKLSTQEPYLPQWERIQVTNQNILSLRCQIGVIPLEQKGKSNSHEMLLFGGLIHLFNNFWNSDV